MVLTVLRIGIKIEESLHIVGEGYVRMPYALRKGDAVTVPFLKGTLKTSVKKCEIYETVWIGEKGHLLCVACMEDTKIREFMDMLSNNNLSVDWDSFKGYYPWKKK